MSLRLNKLTEGWKDEGMKPACCLSSSAAGPSSACGNEYDQDDRADGCIVVPAGSVIYRQLPV